MTPHFRIIPASDRSPGLTELRIGNHCIASVGTGEDVARVVVEHALKRIDVEATVDEIIHQLGAAA